MTTEVGGTTMLDRRKVLKIGGGFAMGATLGIGAAGFAADGSAPDSDPLALVDPELRPLAKLVLGYTKNFPALSDQTLPQMRALGLKYALPPLADVSAVERQIPGFRGQPDVMVDIVNAKRGAARPGILHVHGGGFISGSAKAGLHDIQQLSTDLDCTIVSVDYRLAPETRFTGSVEDNYAALRWMHANAAEIGVDPARIAVMGESAGGGHAALLAIAARDRGEVPLIFQMLIYPMLDDRTGSSRPAPKHVGRIGWTREANRFGWKSFLGQEPGGSKVPAAAVPARVANLSGLPPAFIGVGALDLFVDEDVEYARRLVDVGVPMEFHLVPGAFHGFDNVKTASVAKRFAAAKLEALRRAFGASSVPTP